MRNERPIACHFGREAELAKMVAEAERARELRSRFNGDIVMRETGLTGRELGAFMRAFREQHDVETMSAADVLSAIRAMSLD